MNFRVSHVHPLLQTFNGNDPLETIRGHIVEIAFKLHQIISFVIQH